MRGFKTAQRRHVRSARPRPPVWTFPSGDWELIHFPRAALHGTSGSALPVSNTVQVVQSTRGASSHQHNPFVILAEPETGETAGACFGAMLVYSGSYKIELERDQRQSTRLVLGIQNDTFSWLQPGEIFSTPEVLFSYSDKGLETLSHQYHRFLRRHICRGGYRDIRRPILINNWEAIYFDFDGEKLLGMLDRRRDLGIVPLFWTTAGSASGTTTTVLPGRLGRQQGKAASRLGSLIEHPCARYVQFGLWIEPEMVRGLRPVPRPSGMGDPQGGPPLCARRCQRRWSLIWPARMSAHICMTASPRFSRGTTSPISNGT
ncbi:MAG: alpha-galactosidase [Oscillospiraceae bacterium]